MSNVKKGLAAIKQYQEEQKQKAAERDRPKAEWLSSVFPKKTGDVITLEFLQELDPEATGYNEDRGVGFIIVEHEAPGKDGFKRRASCTVDSEEEDHSCYACERRKIDFKEGWKTKSNLYINVLLEGKVYVLSRNANSPFVQQLIEEAVDEGTITGKKYKITKTGEGTGTNWLLKALKEDASGADVEVFNLEETVVRNIPYAKQAEYYGAVWSGPEGESAGESSAPSKPSASDDEW